VAPEFTDSLLSLVEITLSCMETKAIVCVKGAKQCLFLNFILALVKSKIWPVKVAIYKRETIERIAKLAYTLLKKAQLGDDPMAGGASTVDEVSLYHYIIPAPIVS
jgi:hypothetical protein